MICEICGKTVDDEAHFCPNCGASLRRGAQFEEYRNQAPAPERVTEPAAAEETVTFRNWFATLILPFIPMVVMFAFLAMLIVRALSGNGRPSKKNWARAQLAVSALVFLLFVFMLSSMMKDPTFQSFMQQYMQLLQ